MKKNLTWGKDIFMKKILLFATALTGFAVVAQAQEATTIKTTTVQYQVPTCTNCRTTTQVRTTYPEPEPVCETCQPVVAQPVVMKKKEKKRVGLKCHDNHDLGIHNPLFVLREGQFSIQQVDGVFKEPKREIGKDPATGEKHYRIGTRGYQAYGRVAYGLTDKWSVQVFGGHKYSAPKTNQYRAFQREQAEAAGHPELGYGPIPHSNGYDAALGTYYHLLDLCHFDAIVGVEGNWHREKTKTGKDVRRVDGYKAGPTATIGFNLGWFTPYVSASYKWGRHEVVKDEKTGDKKWERDHNYWVNPGIYIQPSKWYAFDVNVDKTEDLPHQWNAGVDIYPYKNIVVGAQFNTRRPLKHPMDIFGVSGIAKIVF